jgi:fatty acid desaturase
MKKYRTIPSKQTGMLLLFEFVLVGMILILTAISIFAGGWYMMILLPNLILLGWRQSVIRDTIGHEASHYNLFSSRSLNESFANALMIVSIETLTSYRREHQVHHRKDVLGTDDDPSIQGYLWWELDKITHFRLITKIITGKGICWVRERFQSMSQSEQIYLKICWGAIIAISTMYVYLFATVIFWLVAQVTSQVYFEVMAEVVDHYKASGTRNSNKGFWFMPFKMWGSGFHDLHHQYPGIPSLQLKRLVHDHPEIETADDLSMKDTIALLGKE